MRTKVVGYLIIALAVIKGVVDILDGGSFNLNQHFEEIMAALSGAGLIFLRSGVSKSK